MNIRLDSLDFGVKIGYFGGFRTGLAGCAEKWPFLRSKTTFVKDLEEMRENRPGESV